ncbi:MAG TPA: hypothetical protein VGN09_15500 [Vicinamibacteria bacterium]|jgi:peptidoglycan/LPS O-acetylase OafA/YrhL
MVGLYVAATVVSLIQFFRRRERRLLPLLCLFAFLAAARYLGPGRIGSAAFEVAAIAAGLVLVALLTPRHAAVR